MTLQTRLKTTIRHPLFMTLYLPSLFFMFGYGMLSPILPLYAADFKVSYKLIGIFLAGQAIGQIFGDIPAGILLRRFGQRNVMLVGLVITTIAIMLLFWAQTIFIATLYQIVAGFSSALYNVARHDYLTTAVRTEKRGRAIALYGGLFRVGRFVGPTIGAFIAAHWGLRTPFLVYGLLVLITFIIVFYYVPPVEQMPSGKNKQHFMPMLKANYRILFKAGSGQIFVQMLRSGTAVIVPLFGADILGLDIKQIGFIMSIAAGMDMLMFYPAGMVMDRKGRKYAVVPSFIFQTIGMAVLPFTASFLGLLGAASLIGFANGLSSGTMMTIGSDLAPDDTRGEFLGIWRLIGDAGGMGGPLVIGGIASLLTLQASALVIAGTGVLAATVFGFFVPETLRR